MDLLRSFIDKNRGKAAIFGARVSHQSPESYNVNLYISEMAFLRSSWDVSNGVTACLALIYILLYVSWHVLAENHKVVFVGDVIWRHLSCIVRRSNMPFHRGHNDVDLRMWLIMLYWLQNMIIRFWTRQRYIPGQTQSHEYNFSVKQTLTLSALSRWVVIFVTSVTSDLSYSECLQDSTCT